MTETPAVSLPEPAPQRNTLVRGGIQITSNSESVEDIEKNFDSQERPKDGEPEDEQEEKRRKRLSKAARELGRARHPKVEGDDETRAKGDASDTRPDARKGNPRHDPTARVAEATREAAESRRAKEKAEAEAKTEREEKAALKARLDALEAKAQVPSSPRPAEGGGAVPSSAPPPATAKEPEFKPPMRSAYPEGQEGSDKWLVDYNKYGADYAAEQATQRALARIEAQRKNDERARVEAYLIDQSTKIFQAREQTEPEWYKQVSQETWNVWQHGTHNKHPDDKQVRTEEVIGDFLHRMGNKIPDALKTLSADDNAELKRLYSLRTWEELVIELRVLGKTLQTPSAAPTATAPKGQVSKAHPPVRPVTGAPTAPETELSDDLTDTDFIRKANQKYGKRFARGSR